MKSLTFKDKQQKLIDNFAKRNNPCCAGCDWWRWINVSLGECIKSAPVSGRERVSLIGVQNCSLTPDAGHILTPRKHVCGDFKDE